MNKTNIVLSPTIILQILVNEAVFKHGYTMEETLRALKGKFKIADIKEAWYKASVVTV